jgi:site-specific DNA-adenine methylase
MDKPKYIDSPLRYTGSKYKLLPQLMPLFPEKVSTFYDMFCGGLAVSLNTKADEYVVNDLSPQLITLYDAMRTYGHDFVTYVNNLLADFDVRPDNEDGYMKLREDYNHGRRSPHKLFALIMTAYNSSIENSGAFK